MCKKLIYLSFVFAFCTVAMPADIAFYVGEPNPGWYEVANQNADVATIIAQAGYMFNDIQQFDDNQLTEFGTWVDNNSNDGEMDIIWLNGCLPSVLYPLANASPDGSRAELWLDNGNMIINVGDWFAYCTYEGGTRGGPGAAADNGPSGAGNILDLPNGVIASADGTMLAVTAAGQVYLPSLNDPAETDRPVVLSNVQVPWEVAEIFAGNATHADPIVIHNTATDGYLAIINQASGGPAGWIDNRGLTCAEFIVNWVGTIDNARNPDPPDGATGVTSPLLSWDVPSIAQWHDIYLGTDETAVTNATSSDPMGPAEVYKARQVLAWAMWYEVGGWVAGQTYYWRVDEVEADGTTIHVGDVWSFTAAPVTAYDPDPPDGARYVNTEADLTWTPGVTAFSHDVYFGTDETEVTNGTGGTFRGNQSDPLYDPGTLAKDTKYCWRIDEVEQNKTTKHTGDVWNFRTMPDIPITDPDLVGWWKLDEGQGTTALDWSGHDNHGTLMGNPQWTDLGYHDGALEFDGEGDYVDCGNDATLNITDAVTVTGWIKLSTAGIDQKVAGNQDGSTGGYKLSMFNDNRIEFEIRTSANAAILNRSVAGGTYLVADVWYHVAGTYSQADGIRTYVNGVLDRTLATTEALGNSTGTLKLGREPFSESYFWDGLMDDVRVYNKALTADEIPETMRGDPTLAWDPNPANGSTPDIEHVTPITWSPGDNAAKHDVYLGTDVDAVTDADTTTTGVYRGRIDPNSYTPPEGVEINQTYYWRIDEYNNDATISKGRIWSFTVVDYLVVDDFEDYDDVCNRIFYTYGDGWGHSGDVACGVPPNAGNGTGSTVGYLSEPYAEQTITHDGSFQSMPFEYLNDGSDGRALYSENERTFDPAQDWTRKGIKALSLWFRGQPGTPSSFNYDATSDVYTVTTRSGDIWGSADSFHYVYKRLSGAGSIQAKVLDVTVGASDWSKVGVMIREDLEPNSPHAFSMLTPVGRTALQHRPVRAQRSNSNHSDTNKITFPYWVKIERTGNSFTAYYSDNGTTWVQQPNNETLDPDATASNPATIPMNPNVYIGLALSSGNTGIAAHAQFSNVTTTGTVTGSWQSEDIGIVSNDAEQLYVALEDSTGRTKDVPHPNPNAVQLDTWQEWNIDLADFAPVDLTRVKKMYIGVGDRNAPKLGGAGMLYVDDIRLYAPRCVPSGAKSAADFNSDCVVSYPDLQILTNDWLFASGATGLNSECYEGDWNLLPDFDLLTPALVGKVDNFDISVRTQDEYFAFRFTGQIDIATAGDYTFYTESDDGSRLYIADTLVVDNDGLHGMVEQSGTISLTAGMHPITVTMFEKTGGEGLNVQYEGPGITKEPIPDDVLYRLSSVADLNSDGTVDVKDYALLADMFLDEVLWP